MNIRKQTVEFSDDEKAVELVFRSTNDRDKFIDKMFPNRKMDEYESPGVFIIPDGPWRMVCVFTENMRLYETE